MLAKELAKKGKHLEDPLLAHISKISAREGKYDNCGEYDEAYNIQPQQQHKQHQYKDKEEENNDYRYIEVQEYKEIIEMPRQLKKNKSTKNSAKPWIPIYSQSKNPTFKDSSTVLELISICQLVFMEPKNHGDINMKMTALLFFLSLKPSAVLTDPRHVE